LPPDLNFSLSDDPIIRVKTLGRRINVVWGALSLAQYLHSVEKIWIIYEFFFFARSWNKSVKARISHFEWKWCAHHVLCVETETHQHFPADQKLVKKEGERERERESKILNQRRNKKKEKQRQMVKSRVNKEERKQSTGGPRYSRVWHSWFWLFEGLKTVNNKGKLSFLAYFSLFKA